MARIEPLTALCAAKPPKKYRQSAVCLLRVGHAGEHKNTIEGIKWPVEGAKA